MVEQEPSTSITLSTPYVEIAATKDIRLPDYPLASIFSYPTEDQL